MVHVVAIVPQPDQKGPAAQFVVRAGSRILGLWSPNAGTFGAYDETARNALAQGQFETLPGWYSVQAEACAASGHYQAECIVFGEAAANNCAS